MSKRAGLPPAQLYESRYATVKARDNTYNKSLEELHLHVKKVEKERLKAEKARQKELLDQQGKVANKLSYLWRHTFAQLGEDWVFLAVLGMLVAIISYISDKGIQMCGKARMWLYKDLADHHLAKYVGWISLPICLILFDVGFTHLVAPQAAGSGLPQIKTILRGVFMKEYLTFKVLIAKWVGITSTLGSGLPLGKEGPLIHMSSIIMTKMSKLISSFHGIYMNESRTIELLGAAWAVGVACTFNAPIGGVLFSVEITTAYFAVRNYWRGFFAAVWGATTYRLLSVWIDGADTITVVFKTSFFVDFPYDPQELFVFAFIGLFCGFSGSFYIWCKQRYGRWLKANVAIQNLNKHNRFVYPGFIILLVSTITFPLGIGQFIASDISPRDQVINMFSNFTWTNSNLTAAQAVVISHWTTKYSGIYTNLVCYAVFQFTCSIISSTLPIPCGSFIPNFRCGAAIGRIIGELMHKWFPLGVRYKGKITPIMPGAYATVGAAAFGGAVTHTLSVCVILFEMTSQITHVIPVLISVLIANGVAGLLTPSIYDMVIQAKKLPYLPDLLPSKSAIYDVNVDHFMIHDVKYIFLGMSFQELRKVLLENRKLQSFPLVDHPQNMILLGSIPRLNLIKLIDNQIGREKKLQPVQSLLDERDQKIEAQAEDKKMKRKRDIFDRYTVVKEKRKSNKAVSQTDEEFPVLRICDLSPQQQKEWELAQMAEEIDFSNCHVDPAPFQLVEKTSLLKVHSLFSMLAINLAYVTSIGKLVGVVGLSQLRKAIEDVNSGILPVYPEALLPKP